MATFDHAVEIEYPNPNPDPDKKGSDLTLRERIGGMGPAVRSLYVQIIKARAWEELDRQGDRMNPARYLRLESAIMQAMGAGKYEWGEEIHNGIDGTRTGFTTELTARIRSVNPRFHASHIEAIVNAYGLERLGALVAQADGPPPKKDVAPLKGQSDGANG